MVKPHTPTSQVARQSSEADALVHDLTVRLDPARYRKLKQLSAADALTEHDLLVKALDAYFQAHLK